MSIDKAKIGLNRMPVEKSPMEIVLVGGEERNVEIGITRGAVLSGQIMVYSQVIDLPITI